MTARFLQFGNRCREWSDSRTVIVTDRQSHSDRSDFSRRRTGTCVGPFHRSRRSDDGGGGRVYPGQPEDGITSTLGRGGSDYTSLDCGRRHWRARDPDLDRCGRHADFRIRRFCRALTACIEAVVRSRRRRSWRTSGPRSCIRPRILPPLKRTYRCAFLNSHGGRESLRGR